MAKFQYGLRHIHNARFRDDISCPSNLEKYTELNPEYICIRKHRHNTTLIPFKFIVSNCLTSRLLKFGKTDTIYARRSMSIDAYKNL